MESLHSPANWRHCFEHRGLRHFSRKAYMRSKRHCIADETETLDLAAEPAIQIEQLGRAIDCRCNDDFGFVPVLIARE